MHELQQRICRFVPRVGANAHCRFREVAEQNRVRQVSRLADEKPIGKRAPIQILLAAYALSRYPANSEDHEIIRLIRQSVNCDN